MSALRSRVSQLELQLEEKTSECKQLSADLDKAKDIILQLRSEMVSGGGVPGMRAGAKHTSMDTLEDVAHTAQAASVSLGDATNLVRMVSSSSIMSNGTSAAPGSACWLRSSLGWLWPRPSASSAAFWRWTSRPQT